MLNAHAHDLKINFFQLLFIVPRAFLFVQRSKIKEDLHIFLSFANAHIFIHNIHRLLYSSPNFSSVLFNIALHYHISSQNYILSLSYI